MPTQITNTPINMTFPTLDMDSLQSYLIPPAGDYNYCSCHSERQDDVPYVYPNVTSGNVPYVPNVPIRQVVVTGEYGVAPSYTPSSII